MSAPTLSGLINQLEQAQERLDEAESKFRAENRSIGEAVRSIREASGCSLRSVARALELSAPYISDLEHGFRLWSPKLLSRYAEAIGERPVKTTTKKAGACESGFCAIVDSWNASGMEKNK